MSEDDKDYGGFAFPQHHFGAGYAPEYSGMTLRAYAAIQLRQPSSGIDWLDAMIINAKLDNFAALAMPGVVTAATYDRSDWASKYAEDAFDIAHAMLAVAP